MLLGNGFAAYKLFTDRPAFLQQFPRLTDRGLDLFRWLPLVNIVALVGMGFFRTWGAWLAVAGGLAVIGFDLYYRIHYHLYVAIISFILLLTFLFLYWKEFK